MSEARPLVLVVVGTDHHPFDRLVQWVDRWLADGACSKVECVVQYGTSPAPLVAAGRDYLGHEEVQELMRRAAVVVSHGGPSTIAESRRHGRRPVVVPRDSQRGEHVDDHQRLFSGRLAREGLVALAESEPELRALLDRALADPSSVSLPEPPEGGGEAPVAVRRFQELVRDLLAERNRAAAPRPRVLYIGGFGRSGSTLLERLLGRVSGMATTGEVVHLWRRGAAGDERCGCGEPFGECEFWIAVGKAAFDGWDRLNVQRVIELQSVVDRTRMIPLLVAPWRPGFRRRLRSLTRLLDRLYAAEHQVAGADVLVDSSKHASYAFLLRRVAVDLRVVHIVRDSCGVGYSWSKRVRKPEAADAEACMPTFTPTQTSLFWNANNAAFHVLARLGVPVLRIRYEDLLRRPVDTVREIVEFAGLSASEERLSHMTDEHVQLGRDHTVAGNPMRFRTGRVDFRLDEEWRERMPRRDRWTIMALTMPLRVRYGYTVRRQEERR